MKKALVYARYSSNNQREESIDAQIRAIEEYAKKGNYIIVKKYIDEAFSATTDDRPSFLKIFEDIKNDNYDALQLNNTTKKIRNNIML